MRSIIKEEFPFRVNNPAGIADGEIAVLTHLLEFFGTSKSKGSTFTVIYDSNPGVEVGLSE